MTRAGFFLIAHAHDPVSPAVPPDVPLQPVLLDSHMQVKIRRLSQPWLIAR